MRFVQLFALAGAFGVLLLSACSNYSSVDCSKYQGSVNCYGYAGCYFNTSTNACVPATSCSQLAVGGKAACELGKLGTNGAKCVYTAATAASCSGTNCTASADGAPYCCATATPAANCTANATGCTYTAAVAASCN